MRIAGYYADGNFELAVNGYWGPLLSWLMVPLIKAGVGMLVAARVVMVVSAGLFILAAERFLSEFEISGQPRRFGMVLFACAAAVWGAQNITPDLLLAGVALSAIAETDRAFQSKRVSRGFLAGVIWGAAFYAKAVVLPWAVLVIGNFVLIRWFQRNSSIRMAALTTVGLLLVAAPWIFMLSAKEGGFTFSTSSQAAHALAGPTNVDRYHPALNRLHEPRDGRVTSWENPVELRYATWSPLDSRDNLLHQVNVAGSNLLKILFIITSLFPVWPLVVWGWVRLKTFEGMASALRVAGPLGVLCLMYVPFYLTANEQRYFYVAVPILWVAMNCSSPAGGGNHRAGRVHAYLLNGSFALVLLAMIVSSLAYQFPARTAGKEAREIAVWLNELEVSGPVVGSAIRPGGRTGLYLAWYLDQPWLGDGRNSELSKLLESGADLLVYSSANPPPPGLIISGRVRPVRLPSWLTDNFEVFEVVR